MMMMMMMMSMVFILVCHSGFWTFDNLSL